MEARTHRVKKRVTWDEKGVASTVGTILALLVFLTFFSLIVNQYVPVWMKDSESAHLNEVFAQFGSMKSSIDNLIVACEVAQDAEKACGKATSFTPITLGVDGIPIFSSPTIGVLNSYPDRGTFTVEFRYLVADDSRFVNETSNGTIVLDVRNRYYLAQELAYENGAIIRKQADGEIVRARPQFSISNRSTYVEVDFTLVTLFGAGGVAGVGTEGISLDRIGVDFQDYTNVTSYIYINHTTEYPVAWYRFFNSTLAEAYGVTAEDYETRSDFVYDTFGEMEKVDNPHFKVLRKASGNTYVVEVVIKNDVLPVNRFGLDHAWFDVEIGEAPSRA